jgi:hypothetical protein
MDVADLIIQVLASDKYIHTHIYSCIYLDRLIYIHKYVYHVGVINRMDVADLIIQVLASDKCSRMELTAVDPSQVFDAESEKKLNLHVI